MILLVILGIAFPIAKNASDSARRITLIIWGCLCGASYLGYTIYAAWEYKTASIDVEKAEKKRLRVQRKLILKEAKRICREEGRKLTSKERKDIMSGLYDETGYRRGQG